ncbi:hypothetical protein [Carboxylicivirga sp. M1479]|uniref:hypothetical protein n=1 Tax=Carboxylicivirga sp. M1479 TaxID=2594476 RepID=UPI001177CF4A|nr:hypothetical protein [Carboxylicivirga sp. M1479]TRX66146.1 hypothetical protein FNN09_15215 [Carboxylicivirga sp. M1479]
MRHIKLVTLLVGIMLLMLSCDDDLKERPGSAISHDGDEVEVLLQYNNFLDPVEVPLKSRQSYEEPDHNYITDGYTVTIFELYNPDTGLFEDKVYTNIDLHDPQIEFMAIEWYGIEVNHPEYEDKLSGKKAYYIVERSDIFVSEDGISEIPLALDQVSVHLANGTGQEFYSQIYEATIDGVIVDDFNQVVYVPKDMEYVVSVWFRHSYEDIMVRNSGSAGQAFYHLVHDQTVDSGIEFELPTFDKPDEGASIGDK